MAEQPGLVRLKFTLVATLYYLLQQPGEEAGGSHSMREKTEAQSGLPEAKVSNPESPCSPVLPHTLHGTYKHHIPKSC